MLFMAKSYLNNYEVCMYADPLLIHRCYTYNGTDSTSNYILNILFLQHIPRHTEGDKSRINSSLHSGRVQDHREVKLQQL